MRSSDSGPSRTDSDQCHGVFDASQTQRGSYDKGGRECAKKSLPFCARRPAIDDIHSFARANHVLHPRRWLGSIRKYGCPRDLVTGRRLPGSAIDAIAPWVGAEDVEPLAALARHLEGLLEV